jgi:hypothetical protein
VLRIFAQQRHITWYRFKILKDRSIGALKARSDGMKFLRSRAVQPHEKVTRVFFFTTTEGEEESTQHLSNKKKQEGRGKTTCTR